MKKLGEIRIENNVLIIPRNTASFLIRSYYGRVPKRKLVRKKRLKAIIDRLSGE
jgi:hypothetical protein